MDAQSALGSFKSFFLSRSVLSRLIIINVAVFILINIVNLFFWLYQAPAYAHDVPVSKITSWLAVPASIPSLLLKPWTVFTYMFVQEEFFHILFNMLVLYFAGTLFTSYLNQRKLLSVYIFGGLAGSFFFIASYNIFPVFVDSLPNALAIGASASVLAVLVAIATYIPDAVIQLFLFGRIRLKYVALVLVLVDILSIQKGNAGGHIAHLGGAAWGFIYVKFIMDRSNSASFASSFFDMFSLGKIFSRKRKPFKNVFTNSRPLKDEDYNALKNERQAKIDEILEKISRDGYEKLTKGEKELLFNSGKK